MKFSALIVLLAPVTPLTGAGCESLSALALAHTSISAAETRPAGDFAPPVGRVVPNLPSFCRETAVAAKAVIHAFYGADPKHSYFNSCSNGGRQALMEAQRFPADFDGIVAGAPANYWTRLLTYSASNAKALLADPASYIPSSK